MSCLEDLPDAMWCVIPVAGRGSRLQSHTAGRPKALLQVDGGTILEKLLRNLSTSASAFCLVVGEGEQEIRAAIGGQFAGIAVHYVRQPEPLGVADAVMAAGEVVGGTFLLVMGDNYYDSDLGPYIDAWRRSGADGAVLVEPTTGSTRHPVGLVCVRDDWVTALSKSRVKVGESLLRICGLMVLPEATFAACRAIGPAALGEREIEEVATWLINHGYTFRAIRYSGWRRNINTPGDLRQVVHHIEGVQ